MFSIKIFLLGKKGTKKKKILLAYFTTGISNRQHNQKNTITSMQQEVYAIKPEIFTY